MSEGNSLLREVSESCRTAIQELQDERPEAELVAVHGDWAYISIGEVQPAHVNDVFDQDRAHAVIRIPTTFPTGANPYGIVTIPYVTKHDGQETDSEHRGHNHADPVAEALDVDDTGFWSYRWQNISWTDPEDLRKSPEIVRSRFEKED
jgi:hypothetical protein